MSSQRSHSLLHSESAAWKRRVSADSERSYQVQCAPDLVSHPEPLLDQIAGRRVLVVTTPAVAHHHAQHLVRTLAEHDADVSLLVLSVNEQKKTLERVAEICDVAQARRFDRKSILIGMGGGVCTDLVTLAASLIRRGIGTIRIPTTLVGQIDGAIGVKGAVNFGGHKNSLGCYYAPHAVYVDPSLLRTLSARHISHGLAEIVKMAIVCDRHVFDLVADHAKRLIESRFANPSNVAREILERSILAMLSELESNLYENRSYQRLVDFGHTFSQALEAAAHFAIPHGEAVAVDMALSCEIAVELGLLENACRGRVLETLRECELPVSSNLLTMEVASRAVEDAVLHRGGALNLVVPTDIGAATFLVSPAELPLDVLRRCCERLNGSALPSVRSPKCLVFDVGGTTIRAALYHPETRQITNVIRCPTPSHHCHPGLEPADHCRLVIGALDDLAEEYLAATSSVAIAFAGPLDNQGRITAAPTIWGKSDGVAIDLVKQLGVLWPDRPIQLLNDVTAAGYRYLREPRESLCIITVGSGIGNKVFIDGKPFTGPSGRGGEMGHVRVDPAHDAIRCDCGDHGHLGGIASGRGMLASAKKWASDEPSRFFQSLLCRMVDGDGTRLTNEKIVESYHAGDAWTRDLVQYGADQLVKAMATIHQALGIERFIIFGGFALALGNGYREQLVAAAQCSCWDSGQDWDAMIELGEDDDDSGLIGAGRYAAEFCERWS